MNSKPASFYLTNHNRESYEQFMDIDLKKVIESRKVKVLKNPNKNKGGVFNTDITIQFEKLDYVDIDKTQRTPMDCRLLGETYETSIDLNITVILNIQNEIRQIHKNLEGFFKIPTMLHSNKCILYDKKPQQLQNLKESIHESGGYFIINGNEKTIVSQEDKRFNYIYSRIDSDANLLMTIDSKVENRRPEKFILTFDIKTKTISATIPYFKGGGIPLFILFRALGFESDKEIIENICDINNESSSILVNVLHNSIHESVPIFNQDVALKTLSLFTKNPSKEVNKNDKWKSNLLYLLNKRLFPHVASKSDDFVLSLKQKAVFLGYMTRQLVLTHLKMKPISDRDALFNKKIRLPGDIINEMFFEFWEDYVKTVKRNIDVYIETRQDKKYMFNDPKQIDSAMCDLSNNLTQFLDIQKFQKDINKSFMGKWGKDPSNLRNEGVLQTYMRHSYLESLSHLRRFHLSVASQNSMQQRRIQNSQFGYICPIETPASSGIGTLKHFASTCKISIYTDPSELLAYIKKSDGFEEFEDNESRFDNEKVKLIVNGDIIGISIKPNILVKDLRYMKQTNDNTVVHCTTSVAWNILDGIVEISTSGGRPIRPLLLKSNSKKKDITDEDILVKFSMSDFIEHGCEFVDANESDTLLIGFSKYNINNDDCGDEYTHFEISKNASLGISALSLPFLEYNPIARNLYATTQCRAAVGVYASNHNSRFDQKNSLSHYSQKPFVSTGINKLLNSNQTPYGTNVIVAIAACNGFNQEDAIILNKSAIERGLFKSSYHTTYTLSEVDSAGSQTFKENDDIRIINFDKSDIEIFNKKSHWDYSNLDENGVIRPNVEVFENTVLVSAVKFKNGRYEDASLVVKAHEGDIVEKVYLSNKKLPRSVKIQTYQTRFPIPGDKFASRAAQKATIGLMLNQSEMPFTADGVVPDLIFNPHSFPSRMTISYFLEILSSLIAIEIGSLIEIANYDCIHDDEPVLKLKTILDKITRRHSEEQKMYSGTTGTLTSDSCCIGPIFYQRLKQQAQDKAYSLGFDAPLDAITMQPLGGRASGGGLKIGQMERDSLISHGATSFLKEAFFDKADRFEMFVDSETGQIVPKVKYGIENHNAKKVRVPYAFKLLMQEIQSMNISIKLNV